MASDVDEKRGFDPVKALEKGKLKYDLATLLEDFETSEIVASRNDKLMARLHRHLGLRALPLITKLESCSATKRRSPEPCFSPACSMCGRAFRQWLFNQAYALWSEQKKRTGHRGVVVTLIALDLIAAPGMLTDIDLKAAKAMWWKRIQKLGLEYPVIGGIDVSFNERASSAEAGHYQVHFAFAILGHSSKKDDREKLKEQIKSVFELEPTARRPVHVKPLGGPIEQLSYLYKTEFSRRVSIIDRRGKPNTLDYPLKGTQAAQIAVWLDSSTMLDRLLLHGLRRRGAEIVVTTENGS